MSSLPAQPNKSVIEGLEVLLALVQRGEAVGVRELARELGMTPTRLQRYVATLAYLGFAAQGEDRRYRPGAGVHVLSAMSLSASGLAGRALEVLPALNDLGAIVALGMLWRRTVSYVYFSRPGMPVSRTLGNDSGWPARESVIGLLLLAHTPDPVVAAQFPEEAEALRPRLAEIREQGFARLAASGGGISLAVPVGTPPVAGLAVSELACDADESAVLSRLTKAAAALSGETSGDT